MTAETDLRGPTALVPERVAVLRPFVQAGVFDPSEVQLAATVARIAPDVSDEVLLALCVAARGPRLGHVCVELAQVASRIVDQRAERHVDLPWPEQQSWVAAVEASTIVAGPGQAADPVRPLVWDGRRIYLQRYWHHESRVAEDLRARAMRSATGGAVPAIEEALDALFGPEAPTEPDLQRAAARAALTQGLAVVVGGPGTGKTRTVARLLAAAQLIASRSGRALDVALAAPTGKAAARMTDAVRTAVADAGDDGVIPAELAASLWAIEATTVHRLLGWAPGTRFRHDRHHPLPHDLVIVDETSMVALPLMARLLDAVRPDARLVLVGDPFQLASVEAGTVLSDIVGPALHDRATLAAGPPLADAPDLAGGATPAVGPGVADSPSSDHLTEAPAAPLAGRVAVLRRVRRFAADSGIAALGEAVRRGDSDAALEVLDGAARDAVWVRESDAPAVAAVADLLVEAGVRVVGSALAGDAVAGLEAAGQVKLLAATRHRAFGLYDWSERIERGVAARLPELQRGRRWYVGRPVMVTANDRLTRVANGDVGLVVARQGTVAVALPSGDDIRYLPPSRLDRIETWWAMTIHKSQGSEFPHAVVSLPTADSPILTRELLYTAVTRAQERVTVVASEASIRAAIDRPISRASGLRDRLWPSR